MIGRGKWFLGHMRFVDSQVLNPAPDIPTSPLHTWAVVIAGIFVLIALALSTFLMFEHLTSYKDPEEQKWLVGIIFMVPVYTFTSFLSLWKPAFSLECNILGNCYEAYALYSFGCYLIACLGGETRVIELFDKHGKIGPRTPLLEQASGKRASVKHPAPLKFCIEPWELGQDFYQAAKFGIVQYMILKTLCALLALILERLNVYHEGEFNYNYGYPYITVVMNFSQTWALYCLIQFYTQTHEELRAINPLAKFICFKSIVFATWWQGVALSIIFSSGWVHVLPDDLNGGKFQTSLQDFFVCVEMAIAAVAHIYIFPATPYQMMGHNRRRKSVSVLADYASIDSPLDPEEVSESERPAYVKYQNTADRAAATSVKASVQDIVFVGGGHVVQDMRETVQQAVEPMEKGIKKVNDTFHQLPWGKHHKERKEKERKKMSKDDFWVSPPIHPGQPIRGIDDPLLSGSMSDSSILRKKSSLAYGSGAESSGESSDQGIGGFKTGGRRWTIKR